MRAEKAVEKISRSQIKYYRDFMRQKAEMENEAYQNMLKKEAFEKAREEVMQEVREEAREERNKEVARNLKNLGVSFDMIQKATGLSIEEINRL